MSLPAFGSIIWPREAEEELREKRPRTPEFDVDEINLLVA